MLAVFLAIMLTADDEATTEIPPAVQAWLQHCTEERARRIEAEKDSIAKIKAKIAMATGKAQKDLVAQRKSEEETLKKVEAYDLSTFSYQMHMPLSPAVGAIGRIGIARVVEVLDNETAIAEVSGVPNLKKPVPRVILKGVDTTKWANESPVQVNSDFEAIEVDANRGRLMILKPFDGEKWAKIAAKRQPTQKKK